VVADTLSTNAAVRLGEAHFTLNLTRTMAGLSPSQWDVRSASRNIRFTSTPAGRIAQILLKNSDFGLDHKCRDRAAVMRNFC
jgi:hypothetical protein